MKGKTTREIDIQNMIITHAQKVIQRDKRVINGLTKTINALKGLLHMVKGLFKGIQELKVTTIVILRIKNITLQPWLSVFKGLFDGLKG